MLDGACALGGGPGGQRFGLPDGAREPAACRNSQSLGVAPAPASGPVRCRCKHGPACKPALPGPCHTFINRLVIAFRTRASKKEQERSGRLVGQPVESVPLFGLTAIRFWPYLFSSWLFMLPSTFMFVYPGNIGTEGLRSAASAEKGKSPAERALLGIGLRGTIGPTVYVTRPSREAPRRHTRLEWEPDAGGSAREGE